MWKGYEPFLAHYVNVHIWTYQELSGKNCDSKIEQVVDALTANNNIYYEWFDSEWTKPPWLTEKFASNHRSVMLGKVWEIYSNLTEKMIECQNERKHHIIDSVEEVALTKTINKSYNQIEKAWQVLNWYQSFGWQEQPAQKVLIDGKMRWSYLWPESEKV